MVTASGGAWNASIVAEYFHFKGHIYTTVPDSAQPSSRPPTAATSISCSPPPS
jgi:hypothetical protein